MLLGSEEKEKSKRMQNDHIQYAQDDLRHPMKFENESPMKSISETSALLPETNVALPQACDDHHALSFWRHPWLYSVTVTIGILLPTLIGGMAFLYALTSRVYPATLYSVHASAALISACLHTSTSFSNKEVPLRISTSFFCALDIYMCHAVYPKISQIFEHSFVDIDGTVVHEWRFFYGQLWLLKCGMSLVILSRCLVAFGIWSWKIASLKNFKGTRSMLEKMKVLSLLDHLQSWTYANILKERPSLKGRFHTVCKWLALFSLVPLVFCFMSCIQYLWWQPKEAVRPNRCCDNLDQTECALPFPSFHHMKFDPNSRTGWRVNLQGNSLPPMKSQLTMDLSFLNELDGFSPMAPILFYMDGLRDSLEANVHGFKNVVYPKLPYEFEDSITDRSITLLWDVVGRELIPHTARVDYLDQEKPIILVVPSKPLNQETHYALAVMNATDKHGTLLPPTPGMKSLFRANYTMSCSGDSQRLERYQQVLLPSLNQAASWVELPEDEHPFPSLQLLFDFVTMSVDALQPVRDIRDATISEISRWNEHQVEITKIHNTSCRKNDTLIARAIHGSLTVPWWLQNEWRDSILSPLSLKNGRSNGVGKAKFSVYVPCSLYAAAVNDTTRMQRPLRAIVEYGHGVFYNRAESFEYSVARVAEDQGYLVIAMDWRGMSSFDMPVVIRSLLVKPALIQATRDNLIQGYVNKIVLQHFARNGLLDKDWLQFSDHERQKHDIPKYNNKKPTSVYYGNSQGGILGAAYTALLGPTGWIDRGILGTPGTSFSLIMYKSKSFALYDSLLMQNFYNNRQIRIILSVLQLAWDPIEPSVVLAPPVTEKFPPMLLQSGLGDPVIPTIATEALARAYNASILPNNPRSRIYGINKQYTVNYTQKDGPHVAWTEVLYAKEYQQAPMNNENIAKTNAIHSCLRQDCALIHQMVEFINTGRIIDPCLNDRCLRKNVSCYIPGRQNNTKLKNWTCNYDECI